MNETDALLRQSIRKELSEQHIKMIALDDDPTGIQTVHDCPLVTDWQAEILREAFLADCPFFYVLTNTRAMTREQAENVTREAVSAVLEANREFGYKLLWVSRSDSTLRGHFPLETDVMRQVLEENAQEVCPVTFFLPAFIEVGRLTIGGIHYLKDGSSLIPVSETEFARDNVFSYSHSALKDYIAEKTALVPGVNCRCRHLGEEDFLSLPSEERLRVLEEFMSSAKTGEPAYVTSDASDYLSLRRLALTILQWWKSKSCTLVARTSSSMPKALSGIQDKALLEKKDFLLADNALTGPGLFVVGSHVRKTTCQLERLLACDGVKGIEVDVQDVLDCPADCMKDLLEGLKQTAGEGMTPVIYTSRKELRLEDAGKRQLLGQQVSDFLVDIVRNLPYRPLYLIAKGGITSHDIMTKGLGVRKAEVLGQILSGVPCIRTADNARIPHLPYVIFPGNVGAENSLAEIYQKLR